MIYNEMKKYLKHFNNNQLLEEGEIRLFELNQEKQNVIFLEQKLREARKRRLNAKTKVNNIVHWLKIKNNL